MHPIFLEDPVMRNDNPASNFNLFAADLLRTMKTNVNHDLAVVAEKAKRLECACPSPYKRAY